MANTKAESIISIIQNGLLCMSVNVSVTSDSLRELMKTEAKVKIKLKIVRGKMKWL